MRLFAQNGSTSVSTWMVNAVSTRTCEKIQMVTEMWRCKEPMYKDQQLTAIVEFDKAMTKEFSSGSRAEEGTWV